MKITKKRRIRWDNIRRLIENEIAISVNPTFTQALSFCLSVMDGNNPELTLEQGHDYVLEIEDRVNYLIYQTTDILKTNALMECADIVREAAEELHTDYRLDKEG